MIDSQVQWQKLIDKTERQIKSAHDAEGLSSAKKQLHARKYCSAYRKITQYYTVPQNTFNFRGIKLCRFCMVVASTLNLTKMLL